MSSLAALCSGGRLAARQAVQAMKTFSRSIVYLDKGAIICTSQTQTHNATTDTLPCGWSVVRAWLLSVVVVVVSCGWSRVCASVLYLCVVRGHFWVKMAICFSHLADPVIPFFIQRISRISVTSTSAYALRPRRRGTPEESRVMPTP